MSETLKMRMKALACFICVWFSVVYGQQATPPSYPLAVRTPYLSTWLPGGSHGGVLAGSWAQFWTGTNIRWTGIIRVDGTPYLFMGPITGVPPILQTGAKYTASTTYFYGAAGPIDLTITFLSPVTPTDFLRQSLPFSYLNISFTPTDGKSHKIQLYTDIGAAWAVRQSNKQTTWAFSTTPASTNQTLSYFSVALESPVEYGEYDDMTEYGSAYYGTLHDSLTYACGESDTVISAFTQTGILSNTVQKPPSPFPNTPVFALALGFDLLPSGETQSALFAVGHARNPIVLYNETIHQQLFMSREFSTVPEALSFFLLDYTSASAMSWSFDSQLSKQATQISSGYSDLVALSTRQAFGGIEFTTSEFGSNVLVFLKEISSDGNVNTVDVIMPSVPIWLYSNPDILKYLLLPLLQYQTTVHYPHAYAMHDMGFHYPNASGHPFGNDEKMPIEESGNMILMALAFSQWSGDYVSILETYYPLFLQWADYLANNTLIPGDQLATTDAAGPLANQTNLAVKGIVALKAMSQISNLTNHPDDAVYYQKIAQSYIVSWINMSMGSDGKHVKLAYQLDSSWGIQFNLMMDKLLGLNLVPDMVYETLDAWSLGVKNEYGLQLDTRVDWGKTDWNMWCAKVASKPTQEMILATTLAYLHSGDSSGPLPDRYNTTTGMAVGGIRARPTVGAHFSLLLTKFTRDLSCLLLYQT